MTLQLTEDDVEEAITDWLIAKGYKPIKVNIISTYDSVEEYATIEYIVDL